MNRLYVFYNFEKDQEGKPFSMCDKCKENYKQPDNCAMNEIAQFASLPCNLCGATK